MELIAQIKESQEPIPLVQQFVQAMWDDKSGLHGAYRRLFNALRSKSLRHRGNIGFALCQLCKRMRSESDPHELYQQSQDVLLRDSTTVDNRRSTLALFLAWNAMVKSGIFQKDSEDLLDMLRFCHTIANKRLCYRTLGYAVIWTIIDYSCKDTLSFKEKIFPELVNELGPTVTPGHADSFWLWLQIIKKFPGLPLKQWAQTPVKKGTMRALSLALEETTKWLPEVHPVWHALATWDSNAAMVMVHNAKELWATEDLPVGYLPMIASLAAFKVVDAEHFLILLRDHHEYYSYMNTTKYAELLNTCIVRTADRFIDQHRHRIVACTSEALKCVRSRLVGKLACKLTDEETRELIAGMQDHDFDSCVELLWAQTRRESLEDSSIITDLFKLAMSKIEEDEDRARLIPFVSHVVEQFAPDGKHYFTLLSSEIPKVQHLIVKTKEDVVAKGKELLAASKAIHSVLGFDECEMPEPADFDSVIEAGSTLIESECDLCKAIGRALVHSAMPFGDEEMIAKFENDPLVLMKALSIPELAAKAVPVVVKKANTLPRTIVSRPDNIVLNITEAGAQEALQEVLTVMRKGSTKPFVKAIAVMLIEKLNPEQRDAEADKVMDAQFAVNSAADLIPLFIKSGQDVATHIFDRSLEKVQQNRTPPVIRRARDWVQTAAERYQFSPEKLGNAVAVIVNGKYGEKVGDRKRAEETLGWAVGFVAQHRNTPLDGIQGTLQQLANSKSRIVKELVKRLKSPESIEELAQDA